MSCWLRDLSRIPGLQDYFSVPPPISTDSRAQLAQCLSQSYLKNQFHRTHVNIGDQFTSFTQSELSSRSWSAGSPSVLRPNDPGPGSGLIQQFGQQSIRELYVVIDGYHSYQ